MTRIHMQPVIAAIVPLYSESKYIEYRLRVFRETIGSPVNSLFLPFITCEARAHRYHVALSLSLSGNAL